MNLKYMIYFIRQKEVNVIENGKMEIRNGKVITLYKIEKILSILKDDIQVGESAFYWMLDINK